MHAQVSAATIVRRQRATGEKHLTGSAQHRYTVVRSWQASSERDVYLQSAGLSSLIGRSDARRADRCASIRQATLAA